MDKELENIMNFIGIVLMAVNKYKNPDILDLLLLPYDYIPEDIEEANALVILRNINVFTVPYCYLEDIPQEKVLEVASNYGVKSKYLKYLTKQENKE